MRTDTRRGRAPFPPSAAPRAALLGGFLLACLAACFDDRVAEGPSSEAGNPTVRGVVTDAAGRPAAGARVVLLRLPAGAGDSALLLPPAAVDTLVAGADGAYRFDSLPPGEYALESFDPARRGFGRVPRLSIQRGRVENGDMVLRAPARLRGTARRAGRERPAGIVRDEGIRVRVAGVNRFADTDTAGRFEIAEVPAGEHVLAFAALDGHYLPGFRAGIVADSGAVMEVEPAVELPWSPFVAPPAPRGLVAGPDSAAGVVRLRWERLTAVAARGYEVHRRVPSDPSRSDSFAVADTAYVDTVAGLPAGLALEYAVRAVDSLGNEGPLGGAPVAVSAPAPRDSAAGTGALAAVVLSGNAPARARVRLYAAPARPGPEDSLPRRVRLVDSAVADADGSVRFGKLASGPYTLEAELGGLLAARADLRPAGPGAGSARPDTLRLAAPGSLSGRASRVAFWCSTHEKGDMNIEVSLAGTPYAAVTGPDGAWSLPRAPAGAWRAVVVAAPQGCFLPDTLPAEVAPGSAKRLPDVAARPNPDHMPRVAGLRVAALSRASVSLAWNPVSSTFPSLAGYEVIRRDSTLAHLATLRVPEGATAADDLSGLPSGTRVHYVVRAVDSAGRRGPYGGDLEGRPVPVEVP